MKLFVNGDSHTAAAEAVNSFAFAKDDRQYADLGTQPHPDNLNVSWGKQLADMLEAEFICEAESGSSNNRIIRTTLNWLTKQQEFDDIFIAIQWSTWERDEWHYNGEYYQVNASGIDEVPEALQEKYKKFITSVDWEKCTNKKHQQIWQLHQYLSSLGVKHVFFNGNSHFDLIPREDRFNWGASYIHPYLHDQTFDLIIKARNINTVSPDSWHFGQDGHCYFARFLLQYIHTNNLI